MKKKVLALMLTTVMVMSLTACASHIGHSDDTITTEMNIAMITDSGDVTDQGYNQASYEACRNWSEINDVPFTCYKPESDSDEARNTSVDKAVAEGADIIVMPGYLFAATIVTQPERYPSVKFVALDVSAGDLCEKAVGEEYTGNPEDYSVTDYYHEENVYCCTYQEEISGYMVGYAAVKSGYRHLGFLGGVSAPVVHRYGYGYLQGIDAAAAELGITGEIEVEYICGGQFYGDADITSVMDTWYSEKNVEIVFSCGGKIYTSAAEAAAKTGGKVIGVDSDQQPVIDGVYGQGLTVTSAMKDLTGTVNDVLTSIRDGRWSDYAGKIGNLGIVSENPEENYVQLPIRSTQWSDAFTENDYNALVKAMYSGEIVVSGDTSKMPVTDIRVTDYGIIK
ncbi:MAG: BMP family ABC transporter substrate-binding protein [Lachnospiraceae bacterium]|nr:BMP family ABC transporter substrate-binding protein [Lachnospiraceae bacterium]MDE7204986.1 BMP family ABC transporter substrate-binding protein [Lachnospiraceae bacterium]